VVGALVAATVHQVFEVVEAHLARGGVLEIPVAIAAGETITNVDGQSAILANPATRTSHLVFPPL
jgi:hypothetical protein